MSKFMTIYLACVVFSVFYFLTLILFSSHRIQSIYCYCVRKLLRIPQPVISRGQAIEIAMKNYQSKTFNYAENMKQVLSREELRIWVITFAAMKPLTIRRIDNQTGEVLPWRK